MSREFEVIREIDLPAAPDDVWTALTAAPAAWMFPTGMEIAAGDAPPDGSPVTTWDPPHRLVVRIAAPDGSFNALDYAIEARDGGTAHLRYVHSGILADGWEDQYDAIGGHTDFYLHTLAQYLEHFNGRAVTYVGQPSSGIEGPASAGGEDAMDRLRAALGLSPGAGVGDEVHASLGDAGTLDGVIDYSTPEFLGVRTADGLYRFFGRNHYGGVVGMSAHLFADGVDAAQREAGLKAWLDG
ncbi:MAG TPA: SRPBCC domain-containing protein, partial [Solirubrobacteraceae bacterium]|nr:SRPBCC domain-containing protein [Solirubrobacteraceae bacterium]